MVEPEIAIVTMNRPEVLRSTLSDLKEKELIDQIRVVDGSEDNETRDVCGEYPVDYHRQQSQGMTSARNEALDYCDSEYIVFIDDDVRVSESWYDAICEAFEQEGVVGVTGKLENEELGMGGLAGKIRNLLFGGRDSFGEILDNGVINGDFFYDEQKEVDHMPGCNMAYHVPALEEAGGFDGDVDVGNSYREDTIASYQVAQEGKVVYRPEAGLDHLGVDDKDSVVNLYFYDPYLTKYFLSEYDVLGGARARMEYFVHKAVRHIYFTVRSLKEGNRGYLYYLFAELASYRDFVLRDHKPRGYL